MAVKKIQYSSFTKIEVQIVKYLFKHYKDKLNARQLAKILNLNHAHINKLCNLLFKKKLLVREKLGNSIYFTFDYNNNLAVNFIIYLLSIEENEFPEWLLIVLHSLKKLDPYLKFGCVFGSSIKSKEFNDIDILIMYDHNKMDNIKKIKEEIRKSQLVEKPIRYTDITEKDTTANITNPRFYSIMSDNLIFYNPEKYVEVIKKCRN